MLNIRRTLLVVDVVVRSELPVSVRLLGAGGARAAFCSRFLQTAAVFGTDVEMCQRYGCLIG